MLRFKIKQRSYIILFMCFLVLIINIRTQVRTEHDSILTTKLLLCSTQITYTMYNNTQKGNEPQYMYRIVSLFFLLSN